MNMKKIIAVVFMMVSVQVISIPAFADAPSQQQAIQPKAVFKAPGGPGLEAACGSDVSISAALDQCGKKGFKWAACTKKGGNWTCEGRSDKSKPNTRPTGLKANK